MKITNYQLLLLLSLVFSVLSVDEPFGNVLPLFSCIYVYAFHVLTSLQTKHLTPEIQNNK